MADRGHPPRYAGRHVRIRAMTNLTLRIGERLRLFPKGSRAVGTLLNTAADALVEGGRTGIFTPMFFFLARKPQYPGN